MSRARASTSARETQKASMAARQPPHRARGTGRPQSRPATRPDLRMVIKAKQAKKSGPEGPWRNVSGDMRLGQVLL